MDAFEKIKRTIEEKELLKIGDSVIVGVSGGPDSICLLHALWTLSQEIFHWDLYAVHVNHQLRGESADKDQAYVEDFCRERKIPCAIFRFEVEKIAKEQGLSIEDAGRRIRYRVFENVREDVKRKKIENGRCLIAVAQNANDQSETVLMRIMRGTGLSGLAGMEYKRQDGVIRPLLDVKREEIEEYCKAKQLAPRIDLTNFQTDYTRNRIRVELLPYMKQHFNENIVETLNRLAGICREDERVLDSWTQNLVSKGLTQSMGPEGWWEKEYREFPLELLQEQPVALRRRIVLSLFSQIGLEKDIGAVHLRQADRGIEGGKASFLAEFPSGYRLRIAYGKVIFERKGKENRERRGLGELVLQQKVIAGKELIDMGVLKNLPPNCRAFDNKLVKKTGLPLMLRSRRAGDYMRPLGMEGTKKIQDYLIDCKVPKEQRDSVPLVCLGSEVIWIAAINGYQGVGEGRISENYKIRPETGEILLLTLSEGEES